MPPVCRGLFFHLTFQIFSLLLFWIAKTLKTACICDQQLTFGLPATHVAYGNATECLSDLTLLLLFWSNRHIIIWPLKNCTHVWNAHIFGNGLFSVFLYSWSGSCTWNRKNKFIIKAHYLNRVSGSCRLSCKCPELQVRSTSTFDLLSAQTHTIWPAAPQVKVRSEGEHYQAFFIL